MEEKIASLLWDSDPVDNKAIWGSKEKKVKAHSRKRMADRMRRYYNGDSAYIDQREWDALKEVAESREEYLSSPKGLQEVESKYGQESVEYRYFSRQRQKQMEALKKERPDYGKKEDRVPALDTTTEEFTQYAGGESFDTNEIEAYDRATGNLYTTPFIKTAVSGDPYLAPGVKLTDENVNKAFKDSDVAYITEDGTSYAENPKGILTGDRKEKLAYENGILVLHIGEVGDMHSGVAVIDMVDDKSEAAKRYSKDQQVRASTREINTCVNYMNRIGWMEKSYLIQTKDAGVEPDQEVLAEYRSRKSQAAHVLTSEISTRNFRLDALAREEAMQKREQEERRKENVMESHLEALHQAKLTSFDEYRESVNR